MEDKQKSLNQSYFDKCIYLIKKDFEHKNNFSFRRDKNYIEINFENYILEIINLDDIKVSICNEEKNAFKYISQNNMINIYKLITAFVNEFIKNGFVKNSDEFINVKIDNTVNIVEAYCSFYDIPNNMDNIEIKIRNQKTAERWARSSDSWFFDREILEKYKK